MSEKEQKMNLEILEEEIRIWGDGLQLSLQGVFRWWRISHSKPDSSLCSEWQFTFTCHCEECLKNMTRQSHGLNEIATVAWKEERGFDWRVRTL